MTKVVTGGKRVNNSDIFTVVYYTQLHCNEENRFPIDTIVENFSEIPDLMQDLVDYNLPLTMDIKPEKIKMKKLKRLEKGDKPKKKKKLKVLLSPCFFKAKRIL